MFVMVKVNYFVCWRFLVVFLFGFSWAESENTTTPVNVGLVLDLDGEVGRMALSCIEIALSDFYSSHAGFNTRLVLNTRDSMEDVVGAAAAGLDLMKNAKVEAIIGPTSSMQANFLIELGDKAQVPIISFSATSSLLSSLGSSYFFRIAQNDSSQVQPICSILKTFGWREAVPMYVDNAFGQGIIPYLADAFQEIDVVLPYRSAFPSSASDDQIAAELYKLMSMQTRVFVLHMLPSLASRIFKMAKGIGMMSQGYVWIMTDSITNLLTQIDESIFDSMQGVLGVETYIPRSTELDDFRVRWTSKFRQENPTYLNVQLNVFGLWSYDAAWALAMAVEAALSTSNLGYQKSNSSTNGTDLDTIGVSLNGPRIRDALSKTIFKGLSGNFSLVEGQLQSTSFEIVNINGHMGRTIGYWTPETGLSRSLSSSSSGGAPLGAILWPGDSTSTPKGWEIPTNGKKLRVGVPDKDGFSEFVKITIDSATNATTVTGYCIDIFNAVLEELPYAIVPDFIPYNPPNYTYDELIEQVNLGNFDAVVGDVTIIWNRSQYVDFTLPYTESGVIMVVPMIDKSKKNAWVFLRPLSWDLWVTSGCFFVFIGFVVWVLEHRINEDFRGPWTHQFGTSLWFSFSTMVFAQRETVVSNFSRFVVIIWFFVVLILTQSYTASLTSLLVQQQQPTVTDVDQLLKSMERVGYQSGSFVRGILISLNFEPKKLVSYSSPEELDELLSKGSANGGIAAAFDENPYMKLFLSKYCSKYTTGNPSYKADGFGFAFPLGSPLVADISRGILNVTEGNQMTQIEKKWFGQQTSCSASAPGANSTSLDMSSFWGLFLIAGVASAFALISWFMIFLSNQRHLLLKNDSNTSIWNRIKKISREYERRDLTSHTFKKRDINERSGISTGGGARGFEFGSPESNFIQSSPERNDQFFVEQGRFSYEAGGPSHSDGGSPNILPAVELCAQNPETIAR